MEENKKQCMRCGKRVNRDELSLTYDCHGIPFRYVCPECAEEVDERGYDGEYYTEFEECIDEYY